MVNPLHDKLFKFILVASCTCNHFNAAWVRKQWPTIDILWVQNCLTDVGPIVGHGSDNDAHCHQLMLKYYIINDGVQFALNWPGWMLTTSIDVNGEVKWSS